MTRLAMMSLAARAASGGKVKARLFVADRSWHRQAGAAASGGAQQSAERCDWVSGVSQGGA